MTYDQSPLRSAAQYRRGLAVKILVSRLERDDANTTRLDRYTRHRDAWTGLTPAREQGRLAQ